MSLSTWLKEFAPKQKIKKGDNLVALKYVQRKWTGALPENLVRHHLHWESGGSIREDRKPHRAYYFDADTCILCDWYHPTSAPCKNCPLTVETGHRCDEGRLSSPWHSFTRVNDPKPMLTLISDALVREEYLAL